MVDLETVMAESTTAVQASKLTTGTFDGFTGLVAGGWAWNPQEPGRRLTVVLEIDGIQVDQVRANLFRHDLAASGIGDGAYGFRFTLQDSLRDDRPHQVAVRLADTGEALAYSPRTFCAGGMTAKADFELEESNLEDWPGKAIALQRELEQIAFDDMRRPLFESHLAYLLGTRGAPLLTFRKFLEENKDLVISDVHLMNDIVEAAFCMEALDSVEAILKLKYGVPLRVEFGRDDAPDNASIVLWSLYRDVGSTFTFSRSLSAHPYAGVLLKHWVQEMPVLAAYQMLPDHETGKVWLNLGDIGSVPGLAYCDNRQGYHLLPDPIFIGTEGYATAKSIYARQAIPWHSRLPIAFWRGQTTGWHDSQGKLVRSWRDLPRVQLCQLAQSDAAQGRLDAALSGLAQITRAEDLEEIRRAGLIKSFVHWKNFQAYKYQIDIDGNTNAWPGLFTKLCSGSTVLKIRSPCGFRQWYYDRLVPWENYVPVEADMSDLLEKISWLMEHDELASQIGENGRRLAFSMSGRSEISFAMATIRQSLQADRSGIAAKQGTNISQL